jgi:hypothetical protein
MRYAKDEASRKRILGNRFYKQVSAALAGSYEYMAMEKLLERTRGSSSSSSTRRPPATPSTSSRPRIAW